MKNYKLILMGMLCLMASNALGQFSNMQLHYETGKYTFNNNDIWRDNFRVKFEMLNVDKLGTYYWNTDIKFNRRDSVYNASAQILRTFRISKSTKLQPVIGYAGAVRTNSYYFVGIHYPFKIGSVNILPLLMYSHNRNDNGPQFRFTSGFSSTFFNNKVMLFGFVNVYTLSNKYKLEAMMEERLIGWQINPQLWYSFNKNIALGTELDISYNRYSLKESVAFMPSIATRWTFNK